MKQEKRLKLLIQALLDEREEYRTMEIPTSVHDQKHLLRSLMNVRPPEPISKDFLELQDAYLQEELVHADVVELHDLHPVKKQIYLWQGDITKLTVDGIVNAANSALLGCFIPCHGCIDNAIHSAAGVQLRLACQHIMEAQQVPEPTGKAKITKGYNLPANYVLHTVGPIIDGPLRQQDCDQLASCYRSCLSLADTYGLKSIAFCCISTGEFHFPNQKAAEIAIQTVQDYIKETNTKMEVVFNVFKEEDKHIYKKLLG